MTLQDFFNYTRENPIYVLFFFALLPILALIVGAMSKNEGHEKPWRYWYSGLIYLACVPGIFGIALSVYLFLFERKSIMDTNLYLQVVPIISMLITMGIIRKNVNLDRIPGFDRMGGLVMMIMATFGIMWFLDKMRILVFSFMPFQYLILAFVVLMILIRFGWKRVASNN